MATSSKVKFNLADLKKRALEAADNRVAMAQVKVDAYKSEEALQEEIAQWRSEQEERLRKLVDELPDMGDYQLSNFKIRGIPKVDIYTRRDDERELERAKRARDSIKAKSESLVPDEEGNISLTKTQLRDFFGL